MKFLIIGVNFLPNHKNKKTGELDPCVICQAITKDDDNKGFRTTQKPVYLSCSSEIYAHLIEKLGSIDKLLYYYVSLFFNESGFLTDIELLEPSGVTIPWKK